MEALPVTAATKRAFDERTVATPTFVFSCTIVPPAAVMAAWAAVLDAPISYRTTYWLLCCCPLAADVAPPGITVTSAVSAVASRRTLRM
jgi:hypothetical protein